MTEDVTYSKWIEDLVIPPRKDEIKKGISFIMGADSMEDLEEMLQYTFGNNASNGWK